MQSRQRLANEVRNRTEILGDDLDAKIPEHTQDPLSLRNLRGLVGRRERCALVVLPIVGAVEANQVVNAEPIEKLRAAASALLEPLVPVLLDHLPAIDREPPVLACRREVVGRCPYGRVEPELVLAGPDVGAVAADHERKVPEDPNPARIAS